MQKEQQTGAEGNAETEIQTESVPENTAEAVTGEEKTLNGTVDEIKDFMFIVTDDSGASYELSFDAKPQGLENVSVGDKVKVTYTGELSEVDAKKRKSELTADEQRLLSYYRKLTDLNQARLKERAETLLDLQEKK